MFVRRWDGKQPAGKTWTRSIMEYEMDRRAGKDRLGMRKTKQRCGKCEWWKKRKLRSAVTEALNHWTTGCLFSTLIYVLVPQQQNFTMGSLAQISSGAIRCGFNTRFRTRFRRVLVQIPREVPEGSCEDLLRLRRVLCGSREGSRADTLWGSGSLRCRSSVRFRRVTVQILVRF